MNRDFGGNMVLAPYTGRHGTSLPIERDNPELIPPGPLDRRDVEAQNIASLAGTLHVNGGVAMMAVHARSSVRLADLAHFCVPCPRDEGDALAGTEGLGIPKLDLRCPDRAADVYPVVVRCPLQGLARVDRAVHLLLLLAVIVSRFLGILAFHALAFALLLRLLFVGVGDLRRLDKVVWRILDGAKDTFVMLHTS
jgi:hypothetical protein